MSENNKLTEVFLESKPSLMSIAYRMLGTKKDAEDIVHEVYLRLYNQGLDNIQHPKGWMTTVCTRLCLDQLKSAEKTRVKYVGPWLPEPLSEEFSLENFVELSSSLSTAFLLLLERLTPKERAVFLLREVFDQDYSEISDTLGITEQTCRKIFSRSKSSISNADKQLNVDETKQRMMFEKFKQAVISGDSSILAPFLSKDIELTADGGGKVASIAHAITGYYTVLNFIGKNLHQFWLNLKWKEASINGSPGYLLLNKTKVHAAITFAFSDKECLSQVLIMRNPDKLSSFTKTV